MSGNNRTIHRQRNKNTQKSTLRHKSDPTKQTQYKKTSLRQRKSKIKHNRLRHKVSTVIPYAPQDNVYLKGSSPYPGSYVHWLRRRMYV